MWTYRPTEGEESAEVVEPTEPEAQEMTLDEWKAMQQQSNKPKVDFNIRRPNEGSDQKQWKNMYVLKKKEEEHHDEEDEDVVSLRLTHLLRNNLLLCVHWEKILKIGITT